MADATNIEWCDSTFNAWTGCTKVSPACDHCYAEAWAKRSGTVQWGPEAARRRTTPANWRKPVKWNASGFYQCSNCGSRNEGEHAKDRAGAETWVCSTCQSERIKPTRRRVFCNSLGDWLDLDTPIGDFVDFLDLVRLTPELDWLLLSKRIGNWRKRLAEAHSHCAWADDSAAFSAWVEAWLRDTPPANVWIGSTVVNQEEADRDIPKLLAVPARVRFLSIEPMLGPIKLERIEIGDHRHPLGTWCAPLTGCFTDSPTLHWIICGGESGPGARPMHPDWARSLRDQCKAAGVPFLFKQWGEWCEISREPIHPEAVRLPGNLCKVQTLGEPDHYSAVSNEGRTRFRLERIGKKAAGRLLDGVQHDGYPEVA